MGDGDRLGSNKLAPRKVQYSTIAKQLYACVWSLYKFENYIYGKHVEIQSNHRPLAWLKSLASQNSSLARWSLLISTQSSNVIDGLSTPQAISNYFASKYQELYTCVSYDNNEMDQIRR